MRIDSLSCPPPQRKSARPAVAHALVAVVVAATFCAAAPGALASNATDRNREIVRELFDAMNRADVAKLDELYAEDFELWTSGQLPISGTRTRKQALEGMGMIDSMFPDGIQFVIIAMTAEGDRVAVEAESEGVHASGKRYHNQYHFLVVIRGGKIYRLKEYMDTVHAKEVLMAPATERRMKAAQDSK
jgi:ketosteroid isomerase-like protein